MALNDTAQLAVIGEASGQAHVHTLHFRNQDGAATLQGLIDGWQANVRDTYRAAFITTDNIIQLYRAQMVCGQVPLPAAIEEAEVAPNIAGSVAEATEALPPWLARVVSVRTPNAGRSYRGRFFLGGMHEGWTVGATIAAPPLAAVQAYVDDLIAAYVTPPFGTNGWRLVVHSRKLAAVPGSQCQNTSTLVSGMLVRDQVASMKSRKQGSGD